MSKRAELATEVIALDASGGAIRRAASILRAGGIVAFPTETVYGLGARASDRKAVARVFEAKARPKGFPLIVHVLDAEQARQFALEWPDNAVRLATRFWPGPLSLVVPASPRVPDNVTGGTGTVAVRAPDHPVALALIEALGDGIAAPSANRFSQLPPVRPSHVLKGLDGWIDAVVDAGACPGGLESTVVRVESAGVRVLRRGAVSAGALREVVGVLDEGPAIATPVQGWVRMVPRSELVDREGARKVGLIAYREGIPGARTLPGDAEGFASAFYDALHELEDTGCEQVLVEELPDGQEWEAMRDRIRRLAGRG